MALQENRPISERYITVEIPDLSTGSDTSVAVPFRGYLKRVVSCINNAITGADAAITVKKNGAGSAIATLTVTQSGSAQGDVDSVDIAPSSSAHFSDANGDFVEVVTDGGSTTTCRTQVILVFEDRG